MNIPANRTGHCRMRLFVTGIKPGIGAIMTTATQRIMVLVTAVEKAKIAKMAKDANLSMGDFLRRAAASNGPLRDEAIIEGMIGQIIKTTKAANHALDDALAYVEKSNRRIAAMEKKHRLKAG
mgnify:CR=1 FL=1